MPIPVSSVMDWWHQLHAYCFVTLTPATPYKAIHSRGGSSQFCPSADFLLVRSIASSSPLSFWPFQAAILGRHTLCLVDQWTVVSVGFPAPVGFADRRPVLDAVVLRIEIWIDMLKPDAFRERCPASVPVRKPKDVANRFAATARPFHHRLLGGLGEFTSWHGPTPLHNSRNRCGHRPSRPNAAVPTNDLHCDHPSRLQPTKPAP